MRGAASIVVAPGRKMEPEKNSNSPLRQRGRDGSQSERTLRLRIAGLLRRILHPEHVGGEHGHASKTPRGLQAQSYPVDSNHSQRVQTDIAAFRNQEEGSSVNWSVRPGSTIHSRQSRRRTYCIPWALAWLLVAQPATAQKLHSYEPSTMEPNSIIYVNDGSCSAGKVLKVHGAPKNHRRKKSCVPLSSIQAGAAGQKRD